MPKLNNQKQANGSTLDFEAQLRAAADKMRGHMDASEYKGARPEGLCLGLIFLKYISDAFEEKREQFYGQESNYTTWKPARMNLAILDFSLSASNGERAGVRCRIPRNADSFRQDLHPDLKADFMPVRKDLANPPFNMSDWGGENLRQDVRWKFGMPPAKNALLFGGESELSLVA